MNNQNRSNPYLPEDYTAQLLAQYPGSPMAPVNCAKARTAPWSDFAGNTIDEGAIIGHPSGEVGTVFYDAAGECLTECWRVKYPSGMSRLCLQIGDKGRAVVITRGEK